MLTRRVSGDLRRRYVEAGLWPERALFDLVDASARQDPGKIAVADPHHRLTYQQFLSLTQRLAAVLLDVGVQPGEPVAIQAPNSVFLPLVHIAVNRVQGIYVSIHAQWRESEVRHLLRQSRARVLFVADQCEEGYDHISMVDTLRADIPDLEHVVPLTIGPSGLAALPSEDRIVDELTEARLAHIPIDPDAPRHTMMSSGTTSMPKISEWSDNGLHAAFGRNYVDTAHLTADDVVLGVAPASTGATGYVYGVLAPLLVGATSVLLDPWDPHRAVELLDAEQASCLVAVPAQIVKMLGSPRAMSGSFARLRCISNGGAPLSEAHARQAEAVFGCRVHTMYGATDAGVPTSMDLDDPEDRRVTTVGRVVEGMELRTVDEMDVPTPAGEPGEVVWRGAHKVLGYMNDDAATAAAFDAEGWYHSGDIGILDADGFLRIVGRKKDMILRGGQNIYPGEIEEILDTHPKVESVAVVAVPDAVLGERACAFVIPKSAADPLTFDEMIECCRAAGLVKYKWPERLELVDEFPMSAGGKVQKAALTALAASRVRVGDGPTS